MPCSRHPVARSVARFLTVIAFTSRARLPDSSFRGIVTSPPYNLRNSPGNGLRDGRGGKWRQAALLKGYATHGDTMPHNRYVAWQRA